MLEYDPSEWKSKPAAEDSSPRVHHFPLASMTLAAIAVPDLNLVFVGVARTAPGDTFSRRLGRTIATNRAQFALEHFAQRVKFVSGEFVSPRSGMCLIALDTMRFLIHVARGIEAETLRLQNKGLVELCTNSRERLRLVLTFLLDEVTEPSLEARLADAEKKLVRYGMVDGYVPYAEMAKLREIKSQEARKAVDALL